MSEIWTGLVSIATAIVGLAIIAVLVSRNAQTAQVIGASAGGFAGDINAAVSPVLGTGTGLVGNQNYFNLGGNTGGLGGY